MDFILVNVSWNNAILFFICVSHLASGVIVKPKYLILPTCFILSPLQRMLHVGLFGCFEMAMHSFFFVFSLSPLFFLSTLTVERMFCSFSSESAINTVSSAYLKLFRFLYLLWHLHVALCSVESFRCRYWRGQKKTRSPVSLPYRSVCTHCSQIKTLLWLYCVRFRQEINCKRTWPNASSGSAHCLRCLPNLSNSKPLCGGPGALIKTSAHEIIHELFS